jgi:4-hydroxybenzoate polyprenyltransferase
MGSALEWLGKVPTLVWFLLAAAALGAIALRTLKGVKIAENAVKTGAR